VVVSELNVPVDDTALNLLEEAVGYHFVGEDENGDPIGSGEFSLFELLDFWSGVDRNNITEHPGGVVEAHDPRLTYKDVILALIEEIRRLRELREN
jgi:hypothetical protein